MAIAQQSHHDLGLLNQLSESQPQRTNCASHVPLRRKGGCVAAEISGRGKP